MPLGGYDRGLGAPSEVGGGITVDTPIQFTIEIDIPNEIDISCINT